MIYLPDICCILLSFISYGVAFQCPIPHFRSVLNLRATEDHSTTDELESYTKQKKDEAFEYMQIAERLREEARALEVELGVMSPTKDDAVTPTPVGVPASPRSPRGNLNEPLAGSKYVLSLDIGREKGTWMPMTWGASGERIALDILIEFAEGGAIASADVVTPWRNIKITGGRWAAQSTSRTAGIGDEKTLRFTLITTGLEKGDVSIPPGTLWFAIPSWGSVLSRSGIVTVRQKRFGVREESRIVGTFGAKKTE